MRDAHRAFSRAVFAEALGGFLLAEATREGRASELTSREEVFGFLGENE
jgi:hypothetical protein